MFGKTPLLLAIINNNNINTITTLLKAHANPNIQIQDKANLKIQYLSGYTPLMLAISSGWNMSDKINTIKALLTAGANINIKSASGQTAISLALSHRNDSSNIRELLLNPEWTSQDALPESEIDKLLPVVTVREIATREDEDIDNRIAKIAKHPRLIPFVVANILNHIETNSLSSNDMAIIHKLPMIRRELAPILIDYLIKHPELNIDYHISSIRPALSRTIISKLTDPKTDSTIEHMIVHHFLMTNNFRNDDIQDQIVRELTRNHPLNPQDKSAIDVFMAKSPSIKNKLTVALFENATPKERESLLQDNTLSEFLKKKFLDRIGIPFGYYQPGDDEIMQKYAKEFAEIVISSPNTHLANVLSSDKRIDEALKAREKREIEHPPETQEDQQSPVVRIVTRADPSEPTKTPPSPPSRLKKT
jgi:hypothetical protein